MEQISITVRACQFADNQQRMTQYYRESAVILDSFLEDYIGEAQHYQFWDTTQCIGYFAIHKEKNLVCFFVEKAYGIYFQALFQRAKRMEFCTQAMIPTGDELFLSLAMDSYSRVEKQAYFSLYSGAPLPSSLPVITLHQADIATDQVLLAQAGDFFEHKLEKIEAGNERLQLYLVKHEGVLVGFGNAEQSLLTDFASIGMMVLPEHRQNRFGTAILLQLAELVTTQGRVPISGCWYYNHQSKKTMEAAGAYSTTRLLCFSF